MFGIAHGHRAEVADESWGQTFSRKLVDQHRTENVDRRHKDDPKSADVVQHRTPGLYLDCSHISANASKRRVRTWGHAPAVSSGSTFPIAGRTAAAKAGRYRVRFWMSRVKGVTKPQGPETPGAGQPIEVRLRAGGGPGAFRAGRPGNVRRAPRRALAQGIRFGPRVYEEQKK